MEKLKRREYDHMPLERETPLGKIVMLHRSADEVQDLGYRINTAWDTAILDYLGLDQRTEISRAERNSLYFLFLDLFVWSESDVCYYLDGDLTSNDVLHLISQYPPIWCLLTDDMFRNLLEEMAACRNFSLFKLATESDFDCDEEADDDPR